MRPARVAQMRCMRTSRNSHNGSATRWAARRMDNLPIMPKRRNRACRPNSLSVERPDERPRAAERKTMNPNETTERPVVRSIACSEIIIGGRYCSRKGFLVNGGNWKLVAADLQADRVRLVPENQTLPICWESTVEDFMDSFEYFPNDQEEPRRK